MLNFCTYKLEFPKMMCNGCVGTVETALKPLAAKKPNSLTVDLATKSATITVDKKVTQERLFDAVRKADQVGVLSSEMHFKKLPVSLKAQTKPLVFSPKAKDVVQAKPARIKTQMHVASRKAKSPAQIAAEQKDAKKKVKAR